MKEFELSLTKQTKSKLTEIMDVMQITPLNVRSLKKEVLITLIMNKVKKSINDYDKK